MNDDQIDVLVIELIERAKQSPIPVGEATEVDYSEYLDAVKESQ